MQQHGRNCCTPIINLDTQNATGISSPYPRPEKVQPDDGEAAHHSGTLVWGGGVGGVGQVKVKIQTKK